MTIQKCSKSVLTAVLLLACSLGSNAASFTNGSFEIISHAPHSMVTGTRGDARASPGYYARAIDEDPG